MKTFTLFSILLFTVVFNCYSTDEEVNIKVTTTGNICGKIIKISVNNSSNSDFYTALNPLFIRIPDQEQSFICPFGQAIRVERNSQKEFFMEGYSVYADVGAIKAGFEIEFNVLLKASTDYSLKFYQYRNNIDSSLLKKALSSQLISFDYLITVPATFDLMGYYFKSGVYPDLESNLLLEQTYRLSKGYDRLYTAGKIVTHFNHDPDFEKDLIVQNAVWICSSSMQMKAYKTKHIKKSFKRVYLSFNKESQEKDFIGSIKTYFRILDKLGEESMVFITPNDFERRPKCLPPNVGLSPISDNVRTPSLSSKRYPEKVIRNQAMLGIKNDCLPCNIAEEMKIPLKNYLTSITLKSTQESIDKVWEVYSSKDNLQILSQFEKLNNFKTDINLTTWLNDEVIADSVKKKLTSEYMAFILKEGETVFEQIGLTGSMVENKKLSSEMQFFVNYFLDVYFLRDVKYSFDCCELSRVANPSFIDLSQKLSQITDSFLLTSNQKSVLLLNKGDLSIQEQADLVHLYAGINLLKAINQLYRNLMFNKQTICLTGYEPALRSEALQKLNVFSGANISEIGTYNYGKLEISLPDNQELEVVFGNCNCGKTRETQLPVLNLEPGKTIVNDDSRIIPINLIPKIEVGGYAGRFFPSDAGADKYKGGWLNTPASYRFQLDSVLKEIYSSQYGFDSPKDFKFNWFSNYSLFLGYEFTNKIQARIHYSSMVGSSQATLPFHYLKDPGDTASLKKLNAEIFNKINILDFGISARYYFLNTLRPFIGLGGSCLYFSNTGSKTYLEYLEIINDQAESSFAYAAFSELGLRFDFNQDFFIESIFQLQNRWDKDILGQTSSGLDYKILFGAGARF